MDQFCSAEKSRTDIYDFEERPKKRWGKNVEYQRNRFVKKKAEIVPP